MHVGHGSEKRIDKRECTIEGKGLWRKEDRKSGEGIKRKRRLPDVRRNYRKVVVKLQGGMGDSYREKRELRGYEEGYEKYEEELQKKKKKWE
ncbi:hypothetical protein M0802_015524 [Mischocyttarus mexicanus]|nr:hypothetical protein M0802_015524 [Mischocyttarus mexicanus]